MKKFSAVIAIALIFSLVFSGCASSEKKAAYEEALSYLEDDNYYKAYNAFVALGDYKDSADYAKEACYQNGIYYMKWGRFDDAETWFYKCKDYKDTRSYLDTLPQWRVRKEGIDYLDNLEYDKAYKKFSVVSEFEDVPEILSHFSSSYELTKETFIYKDNLNNTSRSGATYQYNIDGTLKQANAEDGLLPHSSIYTHAFDGNVIDFVCQHEYYTYDDEGKLIQIEGKDGYSYKTEFFYNEDGTVAYENVTTSNDSGKTEYFYNDKGQLTSVNSKGYPVAYFKYNEDGLLSEETFTGSFVNSRCVYNYDGDKIVSRTIYDYGSEFATDEYTYNEEGQVETINRTYVDSNKGSLKVKYSYDEIFFYDGETPKDYLY